MLVSAVALMAADLLVHANVAFMIPNEYLQVIRLHEGWFVRIIQPVVYSL